MGIQLSYCNGADPIRADMWPGPGKIKYNEVEERRRCRTLGPGPGNWDGQYSIRINDQYRICFCFEDGEASRVELVDYH